MLPRRRRIVIEEAPHEADNIPQILQHLLES